MPESNIPAESKQSKSEYIEKMFKTTMGPCDCSELYIRPNIPADKLKNALASYAKGAQNEIVIGLIDATFFGSADEGLICTDQGIYWNPESLSSEGRSLKYENVNVKTIKRGEIILEDNSEIYVTPLYYKDNKLICEFLKTARDYCIDYANLTPENKSGQPEAAQGLINCAFCKNLVKVSVTYCKHCGVKIRG